MVATPKTVKVTLDSTIDELLAGADVEPILLEKNGTVYRLSREDAQNDIWAGYDPEKVLQALEEFAGSWSDIDTDRLIAELYEARERGSTLQPALMAYLLDAAWIIQVLRGRREAVAGLSRLRGGGIAVCRVTIAEVYEGAFNSSNPEAKLNGVRQVLSPFPVLDLNDTVAVRFGDLRAYLRRRGELISDLDLLVAATALVHDLTLLTFNRRHFERVPGLKLYQPT